MRVDVGDKHVSDAWYVCRLHGDCNQVVTSRSQSSL